MGAICIQTINAQIMPTLTTEPTTFHAGAYVTWEKVFSDYSATDGWAVKYTLSGSGGTVTVKTASSSGTTHTFELTAAETAALTKGKYKLFVFAESGAQKIPLTTTTVTVLANLFTAAATDQRTDNQIILDAIIAVIKGRATKQHAEIAIAGRNIMLLSPAELYRWQKVYEHEVEKEVNAERIANGGQATRNLIQFVNPS